MASFAVDITSVRFAATNTGYKDITITGMPQAGVNCTITGTDASSFGYRIPGSDQNVYRVYTTSNVNIGTNASQHTATFRITNLEDSTDYVDVSLEQLSYPGYPLVRGVSNVYDNIYAYYNGDSSMSARLFAEYRTDDVGTYAIVYVDGYEGTTTLSESWAYYTEESAYTDTGFKQIKIGATNNYGSAYRSCRITFGSGYTSYLYQNAYLSNSAGCTSPTLFSANGGTNDVYTYLTHLQTPVSNYDYTSYTNDGLTYTINKYGGIGSDYYYVRWEVTVGSNATDNILRGALLFRNTSNNTTLGFTLVRQDAASGPAQTLTADPAVLSYPASGGGRTLDVTYATSLSTNESSFPSWLGATYVSVGSSGRSYTITAASNNTSIARSFDFELEDVNMSLTVPITQASGTPASLSISPTSDSVGSSSGSVQVTVTSSGISDLSYTISDSWIQSAGTPVGGVYTFTYASKSSSGQRTGTVTFYGGGLSETYTLIQAGASQLVVSPTSDSVGSSSGTVSVSVSGGSNISYSISQDAQGWLSVTGSGGSYSVSYTANTGSSSRTGVVTFSATDAISGTFTLTQSATSQIDVSPATKSVGSSSGSGMVFVYGPSSSSISYSISQDAQGWLSVSGSGGSYSVSYTANTGSSSRTGVVTFSADGYIPGTYTLTQAATASLSISPTSKTVSGASGRVDITVNQTGIDDLQYTFSDDSDFVFSHTEGNVYVFSYRGNTSSLQSRTAMIYFSGGGLSETFTLNQQPNSGIMSLNLIPESDSVDGDSGYVYVTVSASAMSYSSISRSIDGSWLSYVSSAGWIDKYLYRDNPSGVERTATVTYTGQGGLVKTYTIVQNAGVSPDNPRGLKAYPKKLRYYKEGGNINVTFTNRPVSGIGYQIIYIDGSGWLTVADGGSYKTVTAAANSGIRRRATIKFYDLGDSTNYVILPVIQGSVDGYDSIWVDHLFYPEDRDENGNYYYRLVNQDGGYEYFVGVSTEPEGSGNVGIDIPRLVEGHLDTNFATSGSGLGWNDMQLSYFTIDIYNMTDTGWPGVVDDTFKYCNDWSRIEKRYDYTRSLNDPINFKGTDNMFIPFCVYYDDAATFSIVDTEKNGSVNTYTFTSPSTPFAMRYDSFYDTKRADYRQDGDILFSYDMTHCGPGAFIYRNRFGGWDSFLIEGNVIKTDNYTKQNWRRKGFYNNGVNDSLGYGPNEKITDSVDINTTYEAYTGWLTDEESARLVYHLLSSPTVYYQILNPEEINTDEQLNIIPVRLTASSAEYKKFRNGKRLVNYLITFEKGNTEKVMR